jgi:hypothetical protein
MATRNIISFALWGQDPFYNQGALENARLARLYYPGWTCRFYCAAGSSAARKLQDAGCEVVTLEAAGRAGLFWRFWPVDDPDVERCIFRDCDSRLNPREAAAVSEWVASGKVLHTMHDHEQHCLAPILGGMWGIRGGVLRDIQQQIWQWQVLDPPARMGPDQDFLMDQIWPQLSGNHIGHARPEFVDRLVYFHRTSSFYPFPPHEPMAAGSFVGEPIPIPAQIERLAH